METDWITVHRIACLTEADEQITVFRLLRKRHRLGQKRHRYVLANSDRVVVVRDSKFRIAGTKTILQPIAILH